MDQTAATAIDHRAEAARLAREAENTLGHVYGKTDDAQVQALLAQVHAQLAAAPVPDDLYWTQARELESTKERFQSCMRAEAAAQQRLADLEDAIRTANLHQRGGGPEEYVTVQRAQWNRVVELAQRVAAAN